jgi:multidrug efflux system outer membrane protein
MPQNKFIIAALLLTTSCNVTEAYKAQKIESGDKWNTQSSIPSDSKKIKTEWWKNFGDEALNQLIDEAEKGNHDLKIATSRVREVRYETRSLTSSLLPEIGASANAKRSTDGYFFQNKKVDLFEAGFDASWEIDLWGGVQKKIEAKDAENKSLVFDKESVLKSLRAEVARNYFEYRNLQKQLELAQAQSDAAKQIYEILEAKSKSGLLSEVDVTGVRRDYLDARSKLPDIEQNLSVTENRLNYLVGQKSGYLNKILEGKKEINDISNSTFLSAPADVLATRPDIKSAEEVLVARTALKSSTITNLYPKISLSSFFGFQDTNLSKATDIWSLGSGITAPLINFGRIEADINAAEERQNQALENYKKTVLVALNEVEDSLAQYASMQTKMKLVMEAKNIAENNLALVQERYKRGISNYTEVLRARRDAMEAEQQLSNAKAGIANSIIAINKSLGI